MDKHAIEQFRFNSFRRARIAAQRAAAEAVAEAAVPQAPKLTPAQVDALRFRRKFRDDALKNNIQAYMARKRKKLAVPAKFSHAKTEDE
ncbi:MAG: hypothetical protein EKK55_21870 [Rhodocyclaceae bacterium]|nr:MAG: hypothetical protein EKK55_21870 [Rhodocyclaceae bacterium]